ncbi:hypothetical protein C5167_012368 [Papaver somniferum]|uniref:Uncharacterized protein n=1 Tax=Papaver somniferum TaxID=3469 RepID=A0A4Y7J1J0_PAPSO|nr:hypothetical protein C5167_012368 [Papaver somniferum]
MIPTTQKNGWSLKGILMGCRLSGESSFCMYISASFYLQKMLSHGAMYFFASVLRRKEAYPVIVDGWAQRCDGIEDHIDWQLRVMFNKHSSPEHRVAILVPAIIPFWGFMIH